LGKNQEPVEEHFYFGGNYGHHRFVRQNFVSSIVVRLLDIVVVGDLNFRIVVDFFSTGATMGHLEEVFKTESLGVLSSILPTLPSLLH